MKNSLVSSIADVCNILLRHGVKYLIVGGSAVALHGYFRVTRNPDGSPADKHDLDFWYNPTYENYYNLLKALEELGLDTLEFKEEKSPNPKKSFFKFENDVFTLDFLPELKNLSSFGSSFKVKEIVKLQGTEIWFISYEDLLKEKQGNARAKDLEDIEHLKIIKSGKADK
jgi:predicted nucleotidyltransferase